MKKALLLFVTIFVFGCQNTGIEKPSNLIEKDKMVDILYDLSLLEVVKSQNISGGVTSKQINEFIYKKYKIDSIQLVKSNKYYASEVDEYKKMYLKVKERVEADNKKLEEETKKGEKIISPTNPKETNNSDAPAVY